MHAQELKFWGVAEHHIEACCWSDYSQYTEHREALMDLDQIFAVVSADDDSFANDPSAWKRPAYRVWRLTEQPTSSRWAKVSLNLSSPRPFRYTISDQVIIL